jgi:hypothetical protein
MMSRIPLIAAVVGALLVGGATAGVTQASWTDQRQLHAHGATAGSMSFTATSPGAVSVDKVSTSSAETSFVLDDTSAGKNLQQRITATVASTPAGITATVGTSCAGATTGSVFVDTTPNSPNQSLCVRVTSSTTAVSGTVTINLSGAQRPTGWATPLLTLTFQVTVTPMAPATTSYYLENPGTGNTSSSAHLNLVTTAPTLATLPNYDTNRDSFAGLLLAKGNGLSETADTTKNQRWSLVGPIVSNVPVKLRLWSAMKGFDTSKRGSVVAGLYQCNDNPNFAGCSLLDQATLAPSSAWSGGSNTWVQKVWDFGTVNLNVPSNRRLYVKLAVNSASEDDMWFAYDTAAMPSALEIG